MSELAFAALAFLFIAAAGLLALCRAPGAGGISEDSKDTVRFVQGIVASISALLLSLLLAASAGAYRSQGEQLRHLASELVTMDRLLAEIGPPAAPARAALRRSAERAVGTIAADNRPIVPPAPDISLFDELVRITPASPRDSFLLARALDQMVTLARLRTSVLSAENETVLQAPLLGMLVLWFMLLFVAMARFAALNRITVAATLVGAAAVASAFFLVLELDRPFGGLIALSDAPLRQALVALGGS